MIDMHNKKLLSGLATLIVLVNVWVLTGVWLNKAETTGTIVLSERELDVPYFYDNENSGLSLRIDYRFLTDETDNGNFYSKVSPYWLDKEKMRSLGFTETELNLKGANKKTEKEVFIVLELGGEAYEQLLARVKSRYELAKESDDNDDIKGAHDHFQREKNINSRLFAIDADVDLEILQARYQQQNNIIFSKAVVSASRWQSHGDEGFRVGRIQSLSVSHLYVPYPLNEKIKSLELRDYDDYQSSRFDVYVNIGAHLIPWIGDITLTGS